MIGGSVLANARKAEVCAVVIRADGTREELGRIAYWDKNPLKRWAVNLIIKIKEHMK